MPTDSALRHSVPATGGEVFLSNFHPCYAKRGVRLRLRYRLSGAPGLPTTVVLGGISADAEVIERADGTPGWWAGQVGSGLGVDTRRYRVLSFDYVTGSAFAGTGARAVSTADQADALAGLAAALGISRVHAVIGASYGAMVALACAARHPALVGRVVAIAGAHRAHPLSIALRTVQRRIVREGGGSEAGLALARALALTTYLTPEFFAERFTEPAESDSDDAHWPVIEYLLHHGRKYAARANADDFLDLSESLDRHEVAPENIHAPAVLIATDSDRVVPLAQMSELAGRLGGPTRLHVLRSSYGHDAFLKEHAALRPLLQQALEEDYRRVA